MSFTDGLTPVFLEALDVAGTDYAASLTAPPVVQIVATDDLGRDLSCSSDLTDLMLDVDEITALAQAVFRRITTPHGMVIDAPDYGRDLRELLSKGLTAAERDSSLTLFRAEILKDERIEECIMTATFVGDSGIVTMACKSSLGPFKFTCDVSAAEVLMSEVSF